MGRAALETDWPRTVDEFEAWHARQPERWEFIDGRPRLVAPASMKHTLLKGNLFRALDRALGERGCTVLIDGAQILTDEISPISRPRGDLRSQSTSRRPWWPSRPSSHATAVPSTGPRRGILLGGSGGSAGVEATDRRPGTSSTVITGQITGEAAARRHPLPHEKAG
jgi:hypothetical protein